MKRLIIIILCIVVLISVAYYYKHSSSDKTAWQQKPIIVNVIQAGYQTLADKITAVGSLKALDTVKISAEIAGQVAQIDFVAGNYVKQGSALIQLDDAIYQANLKSAKADLTLSSVNYKRTADITKQGLLPQQQLDTALADLQDKQADVDVKSKQVDKMTLRAPFDGLLGPRLVSIGDYIAVGQPLVTIVNINNLTLEYKVPENYLAQLQRGQKVQIKTNAYPKRNFVGTVSFISPTVDEDTRTIMLQATIPNDDHLLRPGLFVQLSQQLGAVKQILVIPEECLIPTIDGDRVFTVVAGKAVSKPVKTGLRNGRWVQVISGINAGDAVVSAGQQKLKDGAEVTVAAANP